MNQLATITQRQDLLLIEGARILFRNFTGRPSEYNAAGERNFCVLINPADMQSLQQQGWNIKFLKSRDPGEEPQPYMQVNVKYLNRMGEPVRNPPRLVMVTSRGRTDLPMELAEMLDMVDLRNVDVTIRPYDHNMNGGGRSAYLKTIVVTIEEDPLELKYADVPVIGLPSSTEAALAAGNVQSPKALEAGSDVPPWDTGSDIVDAEIVE